MCGIIGRCGSDNSVPYLLDGLGKLEYRGYDSAGIAVLSGRGIKTCKTVGRISALADEIKREAPDGVVGIGHTRWATHGAPSRVNAHPHYSADGRFAVVHNGIIENYRELAEEFSLKPVSDTDTEIAALLLGLFYDGDIVAAIARTQAHLRGSYALGIICRDDPDTLYCTARSSPLVAAKGKDGCFIASDVSAVAQYTHEAYTVANGDICAVRRDSLTFYDCDARPVDRGPFEIKSDAVATDKQGYEHYMMLEIMQQPDAVRNTLLPLISSGRADLGKLDFGDDFFRHGLRKMLIIACGSAYHTGLVGSRVIEKLCRVPCEALIASEFRYSDPIIDGGTLAVFISQSGETADTLAALRLAKQRGAKILSVVNVAGSAIANESDNVIYTKAGRETAVATTKAYSAQLSVLYVLALYIADIRGSVDRKRYDSLMHELAVLPDRIYETITSVMPKTKELAQYLSSREDMYFIGRQNDFAAAMEGSLKMKEISYIHSEAYAAGELKHGTISLVESGTPVIALASQPDVMAKTVSNIREVQARGARTIVITTRSGEKMMGDFDTVIAVPDTAPEFAVSLLVIPMQLTSYYTAKKRGCDIDKPKNLAKSVTVE